MNEPYHGHEDSAHEALADEHQLTWKREEHAGRSYWHIYDKAGNRVRNIIGIEGQLIEEIERLRASIKQMAPAYEEWLEWQPDDSEALSRG